MKNEGLRMSEVLIRSLFFILHSSFFILHSSFFILHSSFSIRYALNEAKSFGIGMLCFVPRINA